LKGFLALIIVTLLWGSSFPVIKLVVSDIGGYSYTWMRSGIASALLAPYVVYRAKQKTLSRRVAVGGMLTGVAYALGLWLQGWGTGLTTASNSAFITGLNTVFVHIYAALIRRSYERTLAAELLLALAGLYLLTSPSGGIGLGDLLVLLGAVAWTAQVILVSRYGGDDPLSFTFFEMIPAITFIVGSLAEGVPKLSFRALLGLMYLGAVCSVAAFSLQAYGQRYVRPEVAALIYLSEPVFASIFAALTLGEKLSPLQMVGASAILASMVLASRSTAKSGNQRTRTY